MKKEANTSIQARYLRDKQAVAIYAISRSKLYRLAKKGKIKSVSLREPGTARGTRLFCVQSIEDYIDSFLAESAETSN